MEDFGVVVTCGTGDGRHEHTVTVGYAAGPVVGAGPPANVRLQYSCPATGEVRMMTFRPPTGAARPFAVVTVD